MGPPARGRVPLRRCHRGGRGTGQEDRRVGVSERQRFNKKTQRTQRYTKEDRRHWFGNLSVFLCVPLCSLCLCVEKKGAIMAKSDSLQCVVVTPEKAVLDEAVDFVAVP